MDTEPTEHIGSSPNADSLLDMDTSQLREQIIQLKNDAAEAIANGRKRTGEPKVGAQTVAQFTKQYKFSVSSSHVDSDAAAREAGTDFARTTGLNPDSTIA
jgi:hypothetical protein